MQNETQNFIDIRRAAGILGFSINATLRMPALLSTREVKELVAGADHPEVHLKLARHFRALAVVKEAEADDYSAIAEQYRVSNPKWLDDRRLAMISWDCEYLADSLLEAGKAARDLAAVHERLARTQVSSVKPLCGELKRKMFVSRQTA